MGSTAERVSDGFDYAVAMDHARNYNEFLARTALARLRGRTRTLHFGAGNGTITRLLQRGGLDMVALESSPRLRAAMGRPDIPIVASLEEVSPRSMGAVVSYNMLEHMASDVATVGELHQRLAPGGKLLIYTPAFPMLYSKMDQRVGHLRRYRRAPLVAMLEQAGFTVEKARYVDCLGFPVALAYRLFSSGQHDLNPRTLARYDRWVFPLSRLLDVLTGGIIGKNLLVIATRR